MAWPKPQPGHQLKPINFSGHKLKCAWLVGSVSASEMSAAIQNTSSKYFLNKFLIKLSGFI